MMGIVAVERFSAAFILADEAGAGEGETLTGLIAAAGDVAPVMGSPGLIRRGEGVGRNGEALADG